MTWFDKLIVSIISLMWNETNVELKYDMTLALLEFLVLPKGVEMLKGKGRPFQRFLCLFSFPRSVWSKISDLPPFLSWGRYGSSSTNKHCHCRWKCRFVTWPRVMFSFSGELCVFFYGETRKWFVPFVQIWKTRWIMNICLNVVIGWDISII